MGKFDNITTEELAEEMDRRREKEHEEREKELAEELMTKYLERPPCPVVGTAYGRPGASSLYTKHLISVIVAGNCDGRYRFEREVAPVVATYFDNVIPYSEKEWLSDQVYDVVNRWLDRLMNHPVMVCSLICLAMPSKGEIYEEWYRSALERLSDFEVSELEDAMKTFEIEGACHGQEELLRKVIATKRE